jgi:tRNA pseudouridine55 synthase
MHSALKHEGKPLYDYARAGIEIARPARQITIFKLELLECDGHFLRVQADCSKGTYIRVLAEEIGRRLGCGAWLSSLRRNRTGGFMLEKAFTLEEIAEKEESQLESLLYAPETLVADLPRLDLDEKQAQALRHGQSPALSPDTPVHLIEQTVRVYWPSGLFLGLAKPQANRMLVAVRLMSEYAS